MNISYIIERYKSGEINLEEANAELAAAGAGFSMTPRTEEELEAKRAEEREGEFLDIGRKPLRLPDDTDKRRHPEWAGMEIIQRTKKGVFAVSYGEDGEHICSKKIQYC